MSNEIQSSSAEKIFDLGICHLFGIWILKFDIFFLGS